MKRTYPVDRVRPGTPLAERILRRVDVDPLSGCWRWTLALDPSGYGRLTVDGVKGLYAHRIAYEALVGPIPKGLHIDHLCRNRACVNPTHLEPVSNAENILRGVSPTARNAKKTTCKADHPLDGENLYVHVDSRGRTHRHCRTCRAAAMQRFFARRAQKAAA